MELEYVSPSGVYSVADEIFISESLFQVIYELWDELFLIFFLSITTGMNLSVPAVVQGVPYFSLDVGSSLVSSRPATYQSGSGTDSLLFLYSPQPGECARAHVFSYHNVTLFKT